MNKKIKKIGVLTSGGDSPGMNIVIKAITITAIKNNIKVLGIKRGYCGLLNKDIEELDIKSVLNIEEKGGTILHTSRCKEMLLEEYKDKAVKIYKELELDCIIVIGGDGSLKAAEKLSKKGINVICIPATIDLDIKCSEYTIGFDTAVNTVISLITKLKDTSFSHERCSIIEVMGRNCGNIALLSGIATGADKILIPEEEDYKDYNKIVEKINKNRNLGKSYNIVIVCEGLKNVEELAKTVEKSTNIECRATVLGHIQRGGLPTALDSLHGSIMGYRAVNILLEGKENRIVILKNGKYSDIDITEGLLYKKETDRELTNILDNLFV